MSGPMQCRRGLSSFAWCAALLCGHRCLLAAAGCASAGENCFQSGCCEDPAHKCFKKNDHDSGCRRDCAPGFQGDDLYPFQTPWSCELITPSRPVCASVEENCASMGCCKDEGFKCFIKNEHFAGCMKECSPGIHAADEPSADKPLLRTPWSCKVAGAGPVPDAPVKGWTRGRAATFWDCNGGTCDAGILQPFNMRKYLYSPRYAPTDPADHGGAKFGEKLWLTGAASDALSQMMGPDRSSCGFDDTGHGGCGQCVLLRSPSATNAAWSAVVMKKSRCPPHTPGCDVPRMDVAVPAHDYHVKGGSEVCGSGQREDTFINDIQSHAFDCAQLPSDTPEQRLMRRGCELFEEWGWKSGEHAGVEMRPVECPEAFVDYVRLGKAFDQNGIISLDSRANPDLRAALENMGANENGVDGAALLERPFHGTLESHFHKVLDLAALLLCLSLLVGLSLYIQHRRGVAAAACREVESQGLLCGQA